MWLLNVYWLIETQKQGKYTFIIGRTVSHGKAYTSGARSDTTPIRQDEEVMRALATTVHPEAWDTI